MLKQQFIDVKHLKICIYMTLFNAYDLFSTYLFTPDLKLETNIIVSKFNGGWFSLISICLFWQVVYFILILMGYSNQKSIKLMGINFSIILTSIFPSYLVMKFLIGSDNIISHLCSIFLHNHAVLNFVNENHFDWNIDFTKPIWNTFFGKFVFWYAFLTHELKTSFIYVFIFITLLMSYRHNVKNWNN